MTHSTSAVALDYGAGTGAMPLSAPDATAAPSSALAFAPAAQADAGAARVERLCGHPNEARLQAAIVAAAALAITLSILVRRINHDEGQYVAAIELARHGWPYIDFAYLQTPLQPLLFRPLALLPAGWLLLGIRIANGALGLLTVFSVIVALRGRVSSRSAAIAIAALICSEPFLLASSLARNDALPMALLAAATVLLLRGLDDERRALFFGMAGLLLGLATSAKINAAFPAAAAGFFLLLRSKRVGGGSVFAFAAGGFLGLLPTLILAAVAPTPFLFDNFVYNLDGPRQWWAAVGHESWLEARYRIPILIALAAQGTALVGTVTAAIDRKRCDQRLLFDFMIIGALGSAYLPVPALSQYLVPLVPLAAVRFALAIDSFPAERRQLLLSATSISCALGLAHTGIFIVHTARGGDDLIRGIEQGRQIAAAAHGQRVITLSPELVAGSDTKLDPAFVTGPFLFRTSDGIGTDALRYGYSPNWQRIDSALDAKQPVAIVTGGEARRYAPLFPKGLDAPIAAWAERHGYHRVSLAGGLVFWQRP